MITALDVLAHLETKSAAALAAGGEGLPARLEELARFVREIAETALVAGDEVTLREAHRLASRLGPAGLAAVVPAPAQQPGAAGRRVRHTCPRCGAHFRGPAGPLAQVGTPLCQDCTRELLAGIRL